MCLVTYSSYADPAGDPERAAHLATLGPVFHAAVAACPSHGTAPCYTSSAVRSSAVRFQQTMAAIERIIRANQVQLRVGGSVCNNPALVQLLQGRRPGQRRAILLALKARLQDDEPLRRLAADQGLEVEEIDDALRGGNEEER